MHDSPFNQKNILTAVFLSLVIIIISTYIQLNDKRTKIVFCDVGQGDAAYIRIKNRVDVLIDAGPDRKVLSCLGRHMPFCDRKFELVFLSHQGKDHYNGLNFLIDRYQINKIVTVNYRFDNQGYRHLEAKIRTKNINYTYAYQGAYYQVNNYAFSIYWPPKDLKSYDSNDYSLILVLEVKKPAGRFRAAFTGDASSYAMNSLSKQSFDKVSLLKIPHHGSKNGLTNYFLDLADPEVGVISVGKNNQYNHPSKYVLDLLEAKNIKIRRTDKDGDIIIKIPNSKSQITN